MTSPPGLSITTTPVVHDPADAITFRIDADEFVFMPPKDSAIALAVLDAVTAHTTGAPVADGTASLMVQSVLDAVRQGLDVADRVVNGRDLDSDGTPHDRTPDVDDDGRVPDGWTDPGPTQWQRLRGRLADPADGLSLDQLVDLLGRLTQHARVAGDRGKRPPT